MNTFRHPAALASLHAAFGPRPITRPQPVVTSDPGSRRLILTLVRA